MTKKFELVFIPSPGLSHLVSTVETAKLLLDRDDRLCITVLIIKLPTDDRDTKVDNYAQKFTSNSDNALISRFRFLNLPLLEDASRFKNFLFDYIDHQIDNVRKIVADLIQAQSPSYQLAGLVLDMFCTKFLDVAHEFGLPSYLFFTSGACCLGLFNHLVELKFQLGKELTEFKDSDAELAAPCCSKPVPAKVLPAVFVDGGPMGDTFLNYFKRIPETKGVMVNTFYELEPFAIDSFSGGKCPKVYPVGPILHVGENNDGEKSGEIVKWLDSQPENSVVFLCFGSMGSFEEPQVKEIASALENSGHRFLWSLRKPGRAGMIHLTSEYEDVRQVLPEGFLDRTVGVGRVIGWAPQVVVLSHPAVGGFVSHCGWNSTLESVWCGVPVATFPLHAEQQVNAFYLVEELGMAEKIRVDYKKDLKGENPSEVVGSAEIEEAIRRLMRDEEGGSGVRRKVKEMQVKSREALLEGGSSYRAQSLFIEDVIKNIA